MDTDPFLASRLRKIAQIKPRFLVVDSEGYIYGRCKTTASAVKAAGRAPLSLQRLWIINTRLAALRALQAVDETQVVVPWPKPRYSYEG